MTCAHVMLTDPFAALVQAGEALTRSHMHPCGADSIGKQESRQAKWRHVLVSSAVALYFHVLGAALCNYRTTSTDIERISEATGEPSEMKEKKKSEIR